MKLTLILLAYRACENEKRYIARERGSDFGIAVNSDSLALAWQKRDRQSLYFWTKIYKYLSAQESK